MKECKYNSINNNIRFSSNYSMGIYTSGCYYLDNNNNWQSDGLTVNYIRNVLIFLVHFFFLPIRLEQKLMNILLNAIQHI